MTIWKGSPVRYHKNIRMAPYFFALPFVLSFFLFFLYPMVSMLVMSFERIEGVDSVQLIGADNYRRVLTDPHLGTAVLNSVLFTVGIVVVNVSLAVLLAVVLNNKRTVFREGFRSALYLPALTSIIVAGIFFRLFFGSGKLTPLNSLMTTLHLPTREWLYDTKMTGILVLVVTSTWRWLGTNVIYFVCGLQSIPDELYEAANMDGANALQKFWNITIPGLKPILVFVITILTYGGLRMFGESYVLWVNGSTPGDIGLTVVLYIYKVAFAQFETGYASALSTILFICLMAINIVYVRFLKIGSKEASRS